MKKILTKDQLAKLKFFNTRKQCTSIGTKPLREIFKTDQAKKYNITPDNTIIVDDKEETMIHNKGNGIWIKEWKGYANDNALQRLTVLLKTILENDLRTTGKKILHLESLVPKLKK